jgi:CRP-like cAMP-binding protein
MHYSNNYIETCLEEPSSVFKGLTAKEKEMIDAHHTVEIFRKGEPIIREGEKARGLIYIVTGKVKVFKMGIGGREQIIKMVKSNGFIGYRSIFNETTHPVSAGAIEETAVCIIEKITIIKILKKNAEFAYKLLKIITDDLIFTVNRTMSLTQKHIRGRLAESLLVLRETYGTESDGKTIRIALSREDIANLSNMTTSNAIRTLSSMATEEIIEMEGRKIRIKDLNELEKISALG